MKQSIKRLILPVLALLTAFGLIWLINNPVDQKLGARTGPTKLSSLSDVEISSPSAGQTLVWDATTSDWINESVSVDLSSYLTTATASSTYAKLAGAVFTGAISATNLSGTNTGNETSSTIATIITNSTASTTPNDTDRFSFSLSSVLGYTTWANIKATLKTYFDSLTTTLTNKRITPRVGSLTASTSLTVDSDLYDSFYLTESVATTTVTIGGTPTSGQKLIIGITASSTAQGLSFGTNIATSSDLNLPSATVANKTMYLGFIWNIAKSKWVLLALLNNI